MKAIRLLGIGVCLGALLSLCPSAQAQTSTNYVVKTVKNNYIKLEYGVSGQLTDGTNSRDITGSFGVSTVGGDPTTPNDNDWNIFGGYGSSVYNRNLYTDFSRITIHVEETGQDPKDLNLGSSDGTWITGPYEYAMSNQIYGVWQTKDSLINVEMIYSIVRDMAKMELNVQNTDTVKRSVGVRIALSADNSPSTELGQRPFYVDKYGTITNETEWTGSAIPKYWRVFETLKDKDDYSLMGIIKGNGATTPNKFAIGLRSRIFGNPWDPDLSTKLSLIERGDDAGFYYRWDPVPLSPGQKLNPIITYFGLGCATEDWTKPDILATQAPYYLSYVPGETSDTWNVTPNPISIFAEVINTEPYPISSTSIWLNLPEGLTLVDGYLPTQVIDGIPENSSVTKEWKVTLASGKVPSGVLSYQVGCSLPDAGTRTVTREIAVQAVNAHDYKAGWQMCSIPFYLANSDPFSALGLPAGSYNIRQWDPSSRQYITPTNLVPGTGYWLQCADDYTGIIPIENNNIKPVDVKKFMDLSSGWNQIANPYSMPISLRNVKVKARNSTELVSLVDAVNRGWVRRSLFWWDPVTGPENGYSWSQDIETIRLEPWVSYWFKSNIACQLLLDPPTLGDWYGIGVQ